MRTRSMMQIMITVTILVALVLVPGAPARVAADGIGIEAGSVVSSPYGTFNGVDYVKYEGRFWGTAAGEYSVPFDIVAPADPARGNGALLLELRHPFGLPFARDGYLTPEFLFGRGFSHATILWHEESLDPYDGYSTAEAMEIVHNFALALRQDPEARSMVGDLQHLYGTGVSKSCEPLHSLLYTPGGDVLDFTMLLVPTWSSDTFEQPPAAGLVLEFLTEADLVRAELLSTHTSLLRGSSPTYRSYEVAGAPHVPDAPMMQALAASMGLDIAGTLDWTPVARALFMAGHRWATEGVDPPPSTMLAQAPAGEIDSVYQSQYGLALETGIARDANGNALGGIRLPDVEIGRVRQIAMDPYSIGPGWLGAWVDLQCKPLADGSVRFRHHGAYVSAFTHQAQSLVAARFLLQEDAERLVSGAAQSDVGKPRACAP